MAKLSKEELEKIHKLMSDFNQLKIQLGDTTITQHNLLAKVDELKIQYAEEENFRNQIYICFLSCNGEDKHIRNYNT